VRPAAAAAVALAAALGGGAASAHAQQTSLWVDAAASHSRPPSSVAGAESGSYGLLGARLRIDGRRGGNFDLGLHGGRGAAEGSGAWAAGSAGAGRAMRIGGGSIGLRGEGFGLHYLDAVKGDFGEFSQTIVAGALRPELRWSMAGFGLQLQGEATRGEWRSSLVEPGALIGGPGGLPIGGIGGVGGTREPERRTDSSGAIAVAGGALTATRFLSGKILQLTAEAYTAENQAAAGTYRGLGATLTLPVGGADLSLGSRLWQAPDADGPVTQVGFQADLLVPLSASLFTRVSVGRTVSDPLYGAPASLGGSFGMSWRPAGGASRHRLPVIELGEATAAGRAVRFRLRADAAHAAVAGDFSGWQPRPMQRQGDVWILEAVLPPGLHHFAFVLDGERWIVPDDAPGIIDDGFGRRNASVVIHGA
jgi:hypothetical protein